MGKSNSLQKKSPPNFLDIPYLHRLAKTFPSKVEFGKQEFSSGIHRSIFQGNGNTQKDVRPYEYGDDFKHIHWNSYAKTQQLFIKTFEEERHLKITLILDFSNTMLWGSRGKSKLLVGIELAILLYFLCEEQNDLLEVHIWEESIGKIPPSSGLKGIKFFLQKLKAMGRLKDGNILHLGFKNYAKDPILSRGVKNLFSLHRPLIVISDFLHFLPLGIVNQLLAYPKCLSFRVLSLFEKEKTREFPFYDSQNTFYTRKNTAQEERTLSEKDFIHWGVIPLDIEGNYLFRFLTAIKENYR